MCNRYACDIRKTGLEREYYGFEEWSETRIDPLLGNAVLEVFPKSRAPIIRRRWEGGKRTPELEWQSLRWGLPGPETTGNAPVTNIRNIQSLHWRNVLSLPHRCVVPFTAFSEYEDDSPKGKKVIRWFAPRARGMMFFAGLYKGWYGDYGTKKAPNEGWHALFSFLTTDANDLVRPVHAKAMPVILTTPEQCEEWLEAPIETIPEIQARVLPSEALEIVHDDEALQYAGAYLK